MEAGREKWGISLQFSNYSAEFESSLGGSLSRRDLVTTKIIFLSLHILNCGRILSISALPLYPAKCNRGPYQNKHFHLQVHKSRHKNEKVYSPKHMATCIYQHAHLQWTLFQILAWTVGHCWHTTFIICYKSTNLITMILFLQYFAIF